MTAIDHTQPAAATRGLKAPQLFPLRLETKILLVVFAILALWGLAIFTFGVPALVWPMKLIVPGLVVLLVVLTLGM